MTDKAPPHDTDAEAAVLGAMLMGHVDVALSLCPDDFYYPPHARIFEVITDLHRDGHPQGAPLGDPGGPAPGPERMGHGRSPARRRGDDHGPGARAVAGPTTRT
jgi:hypothetical protein